MQITENRIKEIEHELKSLTCWNCDPCIGNRPDQCAVNPCDKDKFWLLAELKRAREALKICRADAHCLNLEWFKENGYDMAAACIENIRKHSSTALEDKSCQ